MVGFYTSAEQEDEANLTEIEKERLKNIRQNRAVLQSAGLGGSYSILGHRKGSQQKKPRSTPAVKVRDVTLTTPYVWIYMLISYCRSCTSNKTSCRHVYLRNLREDP